ncbi:hypothetical protein [Bifidobacterium reuteri]|uniref:hypothetical protein n=1 Tax=Bifidobacterium reuteri TaxID=983706 RepID=UPI0012DFEB9E|nr:hypothetical protein [Bifidobacterium reuteri]
MVGEWCCTHPLCGFLEWEDKMMPLLVDFYLVEDDSEEQDYLRLCDAPLSQDVLDYLHATESAFG